MPALNDAEVEAGIGNGSVFAIAIDTSIFDRFGCDLSHPRLSALHQLADSRLQLLIPEIVARELLDHIVRHLDESRSAAAKALNIYQRRWQREFVENIVSDDSTKFAQRQLDNFLLMTHGKILPLTGAVDFSSKVMDLYFSGQPPFERREQKKHEFPDALALLSLAAFADRRGGMILCVSSDNGWLAFCRESDELIGVDDLDRALSFLNSSGRSRAEEILRSLKQGGRSSFFYEPIHAAFRKCFRTLDFIPEIKSAVEYKAEPVLEDLDKIKFETSTAPLVIETDEETVKISFKVKARVNFIADFAFYASGYLQDEAAEIASVQREITRTDDYEVVLTAIRDGVSLHAVKEVFVYRPRVRINFGSFDPFETNVEM